MKRIVVLIVAAMAFAVIAKDSLVVDPAQPTSRDSLKFRLYNGSLCCCAAYPENKVAVDDTAIYLKYVVDEEPCTKCYCFAAGSWTSFKSAPVKAGTYSVYKVENNCPIGQVCIAIAPKVSLLGKVTVGVNDFPRMYLSPLQPSTQDSVIFRLVLGEFPNSCAPKYSTQFSVDQVGQKECFAYPCAQDYAITISYKDTAKYTAAAPCGDVIMYYGPTFEFGKLDVGSYTIINAMAGKDTLMTFGVSEKEVVTPMGDTVITTPKKPTTLDSIHFTLYLKGGCCVSKFYKNQVTVDPAAMAINLSYEISSPNCDIMDCAPGSSTQLKSGPIAEGTYTIYRVESIYCPIEPCPKMPVVAQPVGKVTVISLETALDFMPPLSRPASVNGLSNGQNIELYDSRGVLVGKSASVGNAAMSRGAYIARTVSKDGKSATLRVLVNR